MDKKKEKGFLQKHWSNILFGVFVLLLLFPKTRMPIVSNLQRIIAFSPSTTNKAEQLTDYNWPLEDLKGGAIAFNEAENEVTVLNLWATWCAPCVAEMPYFQDLYNEYGDRVKFYFVSDEKPETIQNFMAKYDYNLPVQIAHYAPPELLQSTALPTTFVFGKDGQIHIKKKGSAKWNSKSVKKLLDDLIAE